MSWRYDVFECNNETTDHHLCEVMTGPPIASFWDYGWKDAYRKAESLPHGVVESRYTGDLPYKKTPHVVFERIEGGGLCWMCGKGRGPLCRTSEGSKFVCEPCQMLSRRQHEQISRDHHRAPDRWAYVPIIDTIDWEAQ
jgi:hypothetical protein